MPPLSGDAVPVTKLPSVINPVTFGLDPGGHVPVDEPKPNVRSQTRIKLFTNKAARGFLHVTGKAHHVGAVHLLTDPLNLVIADRPHRLDYHVFTSKGRVVTKGHVPAFAVSRADGSVFVIDFDTRANLASPGWVRRKAELKRAYLEDHGILYNAVDDVVLRVEPLYSNVTRLHFWARQPPDREADIAVRIAIGELGLPTTVGAVRSRVHLPLTDADAACRGQFDRVLPTIGEMAVAGEIGLVHSVPLSDLTPIVHAPGARP